MDGIHDLGGMHGFGAVEKEVDEPVFHEPWEARAFALSSLAPGGNIDAFRHAIERLPPATYLTAGYYGRWLHALETRMVELGLVSRDEIDAHLEAYRRGAAPPAVAPSAPPDSTPATSVRRGVDRPPRFAVGDPVVAGEFPIHPQGHTRLPRYVRGREGVVVSVYDAYVFPDTNAHDLGESPQHVYCVGFTGRELWGDEAEPGTSVHVDLFESYLEAPR
ncbi:MAG: nitrile hydratase subunit beta [Thermoanaerobaculia bacterium]|nr:nitrile hydratase subunit beta [Thermoanaerobaculia bacterium]